MNGLTYCAAATIIYTRIPTTRRLACLERAIARGHAVGTADAARGSVDDATAADGLADELAACVGQDLADRGLAGDEGRTG